MIKVPAKGQTIHGFDVSHYQPHFDFQKARVDGNLFCFLKATEGTSYIDSSFHSHWKNAKAAGLLVGAYHFFRPTADAVAQANHFVQTVGALAADDLPCVLDWETTDNVPATKDLQRGFVFLEQVAVLTKKRPIVYTGPYFAQALHLTLDFAKYPLWVAHYGTSAPLVPSPWTDWTFWQYAEDHGLDKNLFNGDINHLKSYL